MRLVLLSFVASVIMLLSSTATANDFTYQWGSTQDQVVQSMHNFLVGVEAQGQVLHRGEKYMVIAAEKENFFKMLSVFFFDRNGQVFAEHTRMNLPDKVDAWEFVERSVSNTTNSESNTDSALGHWEGHLDNLKDLMGIGDVYSAYEYNDSALLAYPVNGSSDVVTYEFFVPMGDLAQLYYREYFLYAID